MTRTRRISGTSLSERAFRVHETDKVLDVAAVSELLRGELAAYRVRRFIPLDVCRRIVDNFWSSSDRVPRYGEGADGVEAYLIGASHYGKPTLTYLEEARAFENAVSRLYAGTINPISVFREAVTAGCSEIRSVRPASLNGLPAGDSKAICWNNIGPFLLEPHEDIGQLKDPYQCDFEIQQVTRVMAVNIYPDVLSDSGQVQIWNIEPDEETREDLGLSGVGFPYPAELLAEFPSTVVAVEAGDLCVFNGNLVHAVLRRDTTLPKDRLLVTCFMGLNLDNDLIWWT